MLQSIFFVLLIIILCGSSLLAQNKYDFPQFRNETVDFIKLPAKWSGKDWLNLGVVGIGSALLIEVADQPARDLALENRSYLHSVPIEAGRVWGELYSPVVLFVGFAAHSVIAKDNSTRKVAYELGQASLYTGAITYLLKSAFGRSRPYMDEGITSFHPFTLNDDDHSFPGGHAAAAFALSTVLSRNAGPKWLKILAYLPASITPISRIYEDKHWVSSCFFGGTLGYFVATWVVNHHKQAGSQTKVYPVFPVSLSIALD